jgi:hypothetical protein
MERSYLLYTRRSSPASLAEPPAVDRLHTLTHQVNYQTQRTAKSRADGESAGRKEVFRDAGEVRLPGWNCSGLESAATRTALGYEL